MSVHLLGIRHHGPGSAKNVMEALKTIQADIILVEGPPEGESMLSWVTHQDMKPPVAMLSYVPDYPQRAVFYPFTTFSPEWNAIKYGLENKIPVRFIDMPLVHKLAYTEVNEDVLSLPIESIEITEFDSLKDVSSNDKENGNVQKNPFSYLADIAGFDDEEEWWEHQFELRNHPVEVFEALAVSIEALREQFPVNDLSEKTREAFMRKGIRTAQKEKFQTIVVICGAWHVPSLMNMPSAKEDDELIKNLPKTKIETTWIPWTNDRLSFESGYGAGVNSPGWYQHLWDYPDDIQGVRWLSLSASVFRNANHDISPAHIIEAVRLSESLASIRNLSKPSLKEHLESTQAVMCMGDDILLNLIWKELIVGKKLGEIPAGTPQVPIQKDFEKTAKSLRLKITNEEKTIVLDLRETNDLNKSIFLHRLVLLNVDWAYTAFISGKGTFKEEWRLCWKPETTISLIEKAPWGNSVETAAIQFVKSKINELRNLSELTELVQKLLPAELKDAIQIAMQKMDELTASTSDTSVLMDTLTPLVQIYKYGNVRKTDFETVGSILQSVFYRLLANLPFSCSHIASDQAEIIANKIRNTHSALVLVDNEEYMAEWLLVIRTITKMEHTEAIIHGSCCKILYDRSLASNEETAIEFSKALSVNREASYSANWLEGFLMDGATILLYDDHIWQMVSAWVNELEEDDFLKIIPILRRTFATYNTVEKRKIATRANEKSGKMTAKLNVENTLNHERAKLVVPILERLFGM